MDTQNTPDQTALLPNGTQVRVSDGTPRPPERFNKKLSKWKSSNYDGVVVGFEHGGYVVQHKPNTGWRVNDYCLFFSSGTPTYKVQAIRDACLAPVKGSGVSVEVDVPALLALEASLSQQSAAA
jgi:hypothetical protein